MNLRPLGGVLNEQLRTFSSCFKHVYFRSLKRLGRIDLFIPTNCLLNMSLFDILRGFV